MNWHLIYTKPRQEACALQNLQAQGYACFLPLMPTEKIRRSTLVVADEPLFPRYLFIHLGHGISAKSWAPIRSTKGVSRLVCFGNEPARIDERLIEFLRAQASSDHVSPILLFQPGERVRLTEGAFAGIEGVYQMTDGDRRALVLIQLLSRPVSLRVAPASLRKAG